MPLLKRMSSVMESPTVYALWQAPFLNIKFDPIRKHNDLSTVRRVLDVGCGPGTNTRFFTHADYVGLDINPAYIEQAKAKYKRNFIVADVCTYSPPPEEHYDFVLLNSLLHHLDDQAADRILRALRDIIVEGGAVHIIDLVLPDERNIARYLARNDRGDCPRPLPAWKELFSRHFEPVVWEPFPVGMAGLELWRMVYFKGRPKHDS
jgi:SAM-dependent methyltransferase